MNEYEKIKLWLQSNISEKDLKRQLTPDEQQFLGVFMILLCIFIGIIISTYDQLN